MNSKETTQAPIFYSIIGLALLLAWITQAFYSFNFLSTLKPEIAIDKPILASIYTYLINWKLYSFICFIWGISQFHGLHTKNFIKSIFRISLGLIILSALSVFLSPVFFIAIPIILFGVFLNFMTQQKKSSFIIIVAFLIIGTLILSLFNAPEFMNSIPFHHLYSFSFNNNLPIKILQELISASTLLYLFYGFIIITIGFWIGKTRWLYEYPFHYKSLKKLFYYSVALLLLWISLNYFNAYLLISKWKIGELFYIIDGLSINIIIIFLYLFLLIYFENFRWSNIFLKLLGSAGKCWIIKSFVLISYILIQNKLQLNISTTNHILLLITALSISAFLSHFIHKLNLNICCNN